MCCNAATLRDFLSVDLSTGRMMESDFVCDTYIGRRSDRIWMKLIKGKDNENFYISLFETTQYQWSKIMNCDSPAYFRVTPLRPVEQVMFWDIRGRNDIVEEKTFIGRLRRLTRCADFDLPTGAQWDLAAGPYCASNCLKFARLNAPIPKDWIGKFSQFDNSPFRDCDPAVSGTAVVGSYAPNGNGLYDMYGNVEEITLDKAGKPRQKTGPLSSRYVKGGAWITPKTYFDPCRQSSVPECFPNLRQMHIGFRIVLNLPFKIAMQQVADECSRNNNCLQIR